VSGLPGGGPQKYLKDIKSVLITALVVVVCLKLLVAALIPLIPFIIAGLVLCAVIAIALNRGGKL
jgi:hypothetical protein